jgi:segregation and condensation protein A
LYKANRSAAPEDLIKQLLEYRKYKEAASQLRQLPLLGDIVFKRPIVEEDFGPDEKLKLKEVSVTDLTLAFQDILKRSKHAVTIVRKDFISVSDRIQQLADVLTVGSQHEFDSFFSEDSTKIEVVITFISILELAKHGRVRVMQDVVYGTIVILTIASLKEIDYTKIDDFGGASAKEKADKEIKADEDIKNQETLL